MQKIRRRRVGEILISEGIISQEQLTAALQEQLQTGETVGEILLKHSIVSENDLVRAICIQYQLPFIRPANYDIPSHLLDCFKAEFLYKHRVLPLDRIGNCTIVALGEIPSEEIEQTIRQQLNTLVYYYFAPSSDVAHKIREHFGLSHEQLINLDNQRARRNREGNEPAASVPEGHESLLATLDNSWEKIFDEAQQNL